jgi:hypothetical protein
VNQPAMKSAPPPMAGVVSPMNQERPLGELFAELANETGTLVRQEVKLATAEMTAKAKSAGKDAALIGAGGALAHAGLLVILAALVLGLGTLIPMWAAALLVGLIVIGAGYALVQSGLTALRRIDPVPQQTVATIHEDKQWAKKELSR